MKSRELTVDMESQEKLSDQINGEVFECGETQDQAKMDGNISEKHFK